DIERNAIYVQGDHKQGMFLGDGNTTGVPYSQVTISSNFISDTSDQALFIYATSGYAKLFYNTILGKFAIGDNSMTARYRFAPGTAVTIIGTIFGGQAGKAQGGGCTMNYSDGSVLAPTWHNNLMANQICGSGDIKGTATFVQRGFPGAGLCGTGLLPGCKTTWGLPSLDLLGLLQLPVNGGESTYCPATDIHGTPRPKAGVCDIGADEAG